jgi:dipeptidyl aminopeptidase/acylaminoacyl peptidase
VKGRKYPLLTWVYSGEVFTPQWSAEKFSRGDQTIADFSQENMQLAAAHGYAVLFPSMPARESEDGGRDEMLSLLNGVMPAVDKAIELGFADPERLAIGGHSHGGFSTFGIIEQTNRFKAAMAWAGPSDWLSMYGTLDARFRYADDASRYANSEWLEHGGSKLIEPPWKNLGRYLRNSPIFYVDRVQTPVLIVQGDMDEVPIQQGEEFFAAMSRQKKRSDFVRYWGEGHVLRSPANIRDLWSRVYAWLDEFNDVQRDNLGNFVWEGDHVKSRGTAPALTPQDFLKFESFFDQNFGKQ